MYNPKITPLENLQNEIAGEKYSTLHRISESLSNCLNELEILEDEINNSINKGIANQNINKMIETFNCLIDSAEELRYHLSVTREASGFFHGDLASNTYKIPQRKEFI